MSYISCGKDSRRYHKSFIKASKDFFTIANASVYSNASQYSGAIKACKNLPPHKQIAKNLTILQANKLSNASSA